MSFEQQSQTTPENPAEVSKEQKYSAYRLAEKHPALKNTLLMISMLAGTFGGSTTTESSYLDENTDNETALREQVTDSEETHNKFIESALEGLDDEEIRISIEKARENLNQIPEHPEDLKDYIYYSLDTHESVYADSAHSDSYLEKTKGEMPQEGQNMMFGSFSKSRSYTNFNDIVDETAAAEQHSSWDGFSQHDVMAPADIELEAGGTITRSGNGLTLSESIESALGETAMYLKANISTERTLTDHQIENDKQTTSDRIFTNATEQTSVFYIHSYKVLDQKEIPFEDGSGSRFEVEVEVVVGAPVEQSDK